MALIFTEEMASEFATITLSHISREYPNKQDHVINGQDDLLSSRALHPIFYGSFDWHGCVLAYWLLSRIYRKYRTLALASDVRRVIDEHFTPDNVRAELTYLRQPNRTTFERPYGWAWLLMLSTELAYQSSVEGNGWRNILSPLSEEFADRLLKHLQKATYAVRSGVHSNTALALAFGVEHADVTGNSALAKAIREKAWYWYGNDVDCQAWEPGGEDFLSATLIEAECMRRVLEPAEFLGWFDRFLPRFAVGEPATLLQPVEVTDRADGKIAHLDGLNLSRAWCMRSLAKCFGPGDARRGLLLESADAHLQASLKHIADDYMGSHWLAAYAALALDT